MSTATFVVALAAPPAGTQLGGKEALEAFASTNGRDPSSVLLQCHAGTSAAGVFATKAANDLLIVSGDLTLDDSGNTPLLYTRVICDATADQYLNEVNLVGRIAGDPKVTDSGKSCSRSVAVNRYIAGEEKTDWYKVRAYGYALDKLAKAPKGALVSVSGMLEQRTSREGQPYPEIKARVIKIHGRPKGTSSPADPSAGKAAGYSSEDFTSPEMPWDWS